MLPIDRLKKIEALLTTNRSVVVSDLSKLFSVSEETIRRDLEKLSTSLNFKRVRGGAYLIESTDIEVPIQIREHIYIEEKQILGELSVKHIEDGDTIMLDSSTTALYIAKNLKASGKTGTVISNSVTIMNELADCGTLRVICLGGNLRRLSGSYVGYLTSDMLEKLSADKAFISCPSVHKDFGLTDNHGQEARVRSLMLKRSAKRFLVVDHTKFESPALHSIDDFSSIDTLIIDRPLDREYTSFFKSLDIETLSS